MPGERPAAIGYVLRRFPKISETFVLNEMLALEEQGRRLHVLSLRPSRDPRFHAELARLRAPVSYVPDLHELRALLRYDARALRRHPRRTLRALAAALRTGRPRELWRLLQAGWIAERARGLRLTHLHAHFANEATRVASLASILSGIPFSFTAHAVDIYKRDVDPKRLAREIGAARFVVTVSECNREYLQRIANGAAEKVVRIYNGIDLDRFRPNGAPPPEPFTILSVARLVEKKGLDTLIEACRHLRDRGLAFRCWIVGKGAERARLEALIAARDLGSRVRLLGAHTQDEILERYRGAHLFALPCAVAADGNRDGLPVSIVEALACGLPVVASPVTGIPEAVHHGHNGLLVPERDPARLADALASLMEDAARYEALRANARRSVLGTFDLRDTSAQLHALLGEGAR